MAAQFRMTGHEITDDASDADLIVINSCAVTAKAAADSRKMIRHAHAQNSAPVIVTGCWATLSPDEAAATPGVMQVVANAEKENLVGGYLGVEMAASAATRRVALPGSGHRTRAFIRVQDGCDNHCTYCVTRIARGKSKSRTIADVLGDIHAAEAGGVKEVVLTGVQLGSWGRDLQPGLTLSTLVGLILKETTMPRIRLSSVEPWEVTDDLLALWQNTRLCRHFHMPLQSGSAEILKKMARRITPMGYAGLVKSMRVQIPDVCITTDIIAGFPGETEACFFESLALIESLQFSGGHVFPYSPRQGTPAASHPNQVQEAVRKNRSQQIRAVLAASEATWLKHITGKRLQVLWERSKKVAGGCWLMQGLSDNYVHVRACAGQPLQNVISNVMIESISLQKNEVQGRIMPDD